MNTNTVLNVKDLCKTYIVNKRQNNVLKNVNFTVSEGEMVAIMGPSGSGKSTLLYAVSGMDSITAGEVDFCGENIAKLGEKELASLRLDEMGFIFQQMYMLKNLTVLDNIILPACQSKKNTETRKETVQHGQDLMRKLGIIDIADNDINEVSGGQLQRVCIARAVACKPEIILFDEAISSLDAHTQVQVMDLLRELKDRLGLTYIFITHDLTSITYLCDDVLFLYQGRVTENLPVERISETKDEYARKLLESIVVFDTEESA